MIINFFTIIIDFLFLIVSHIQLLLKVIVPTTTHTLKMSYDSFLRDISPFDKEVQDHLIADYRIVEANMLKRREEFLAMFKPGPQLQRCPANCYFEGPFTIYWYEMEIALEKFDVEFYRANWI